MRYIRIENKFWNKCNLLLDKYKFLWYTGNSSRGTNTNYILGEAGWPRLFFFFLFKEMA